MSAFAALPDAHVKFYGLPADQLKILARLGNTRLAREDYIAMQLPLRIGRLTPEGIAAFRPDARLDISHVANVQTAYGSHSEGRAREIAERLSRLRTARLPKPTGRAKKIAAQYKIVRDLMFFDQWHFRARDRMARVCFSFDNKRISPNDHRSPDWHTDGGSAWSSLNAKNLPLPGRQYFWRANNMTEIIQNDWGYDNRGCMAVNPVLAATAREWRDEAGNFSRRLKRNNLVMQADPYEVVLICYYNFHRSHRPFRTMPSSFGRLGIDFIRLL